MTSISLLSLAIQEAEQKDSIIKNLFEEFGNFGNMVQFFVTNLHTTVQQSLKEQFHQNDGLRVCFPLSELCRH